MSNGVTFGHFGVEALAKLRKRRTLDVECKGEKNITPGKCSKHTGADAAVATDAGATILRSNINLKDINNHFIQPNSFAGKRELAQLFRGNRQRPTTARPRWDRPPMFTFDTKPITTPTNKISLGKHIPLRVTGSPVKMTARTKPLLWLSLQVNWSKSGLAQKEALKRIFKFTRRRPYMQPQLKNRTRGYGKDTYHSYGRKSKSKSKKKAKPKRYTVACDFCTFINDVKRRNSACRMCGAPLPDPETANNMDTVLPCGLTARQLFELQSRDITPEDFEMLCILDEGVAKKTLDKEALQRFKTTKVTEGGHDCGVCQCELEIDEDMTCLPCGHKFHTECINEWLLKYNNSCPYKCSLDEGAAAAGV